MLTASADEFNSAPTEFDAESPDPKVTSLRCAGRFRVSAAGADPAPAPLPPLAPGVPGAELLFDTVVSCAAAGDPDPRPAPGAVAVPAPGEASRDRDVPREGARVDGPADPDSALDPVEPADPVVSANAAGTSTIADPTPNATASAPTRPIYRA